jgi:signal transduction histidine kinase/ligand-binding sensor domain-containing protein
MRGIRFLILALIALAPAGVFAQQIVRTIPFYQHSAFTREAGAPTSIWTMAQTPDGFLWIGAIDGLFRFDGVSFERVRLPKNLPPRSDMVGALAVDAEGNLWIGHDWGGVTLMQPDGQFRDMNAGRPYASVMQITVDYAGAVWVAADGALGMSLGRFVDRKWELMNARLGLPAGNLGGILVAQDGTLWINQTDRVFYLPPRAERVQSVVGKIDNGGALAETPDRKVWVQDATGARAIALGTDGRPHLEAPVYRQSGKSIPWQVMLTDARGALWMPDPGRGIVRIDPTPAKPGTSATINIFDMRSVTSPAVRSGFRDREGNVWFGTDAGLDRFRPSTFSGTKAAVDTEGKNSPQLGYGSLVQRSSDGSVFIEAFGSLFQASGGGVPRQLQSGGDKLGRLCANDRGDVWLVRRTGLQGIGPNNRGARIAAPIDRSVWLTHSCEIAGKQIWISGVPGPLRYDQGKWSRLVVDPQVPTGAPQSMVSDAQGRLLGYLGNRSLHRFEGDHFVKIWDQAEMPIRFINVLARHGSEILIGGTMGMARYDGKRFAVLPRDTYPEFDEVSGIAVDPKGLTWLLARRGLIRLETADLERAFDRPGRPLNMRVFGRDDGLDDNSTAFGANNLALAADGRLWLGTTNGFYWFDPTHLYRNTLAPPVVVRSLTAGSVTYPARAGLSLPKGTTDLQVDYTALSFSNPAKLRFRYRLAGLDDQWVDPGARRQAIYTNLGPGTYRFQVIAANEDGVWNNTGASLDFTIPPTFFQSRLFLFLCVAAALLLAIVLLWLWMRLMSARIRMRIEERTHERERIAREIHDTLLQSVQGLIMRFHNIAEDIPATQAAHRQMLDALDSADTVVIEGRDRVHELRRWSDTHSFSDVVARTADRLLSPEGVEARILVEGQPRELQPVIADELLRITDEALFNVARHAHAQEVEVALLYGARALSLRIIDNGVGIAPEIPNQDQHAGHFGLLGMRERAARIGAQFAIASAHEGGTEVEITIAAAIAYADRPRSVWRRWGSLLVGRENRNG